jgi:predicted nuclease of predicted toxin-antitoxin system
LLRFATDQDFDGRILAGLRKRLPELDVERIYDIGLSRAEDPAVLAWAAGEGRILLTHDLRTMRGFAYRRVAAGLEMPGLLVVLRSMPIGEAVEQLVLVAAAMAPQELRDRVLVLPL